MVTDRLVSIQCIGHSKYPNLLSGGSSYVGCCQNYLLNNITMIYIATIYPYPNVWFMPKEGLVSLHNMQLSAEA